MRRAVTKCSVARLDEVGNLPYSVEYKPIGLCPADALVRALRRLQRLNTVSNLGEL